jgi:DNA-binding XRE family transcriptional regulator
VEVQFYRCQVCGEEFENSLSALDPYEMAYREYRTRKRLVQPEAIREFRIRRGLSQQELGELLGIGVATLNLYENGALQSEADNRVIKLAMEQGEPSGSGSNSQAASDDPLA